MIFHILLICLRQSPWVCGLILIGLRIHPGPSRPYFLRKLGKKKGSFIRVGSTNRNADHFMLEELHRTARNESYDELPMPELSSEAIDFRAASEYFAGIRELKSGDLETLRLVTNYQGKRCPTIGGFLLFGKHRLKHYPDAWIQAGRFAGRDRSNIQDHVELMDMMPTAIESAITFLRKHDERRADIGTVRRVDRWFYPPAAVREAVINAVVHADYSQQGSPIRIQHLMIGWRSKIPVSFLWDLHSRIFSRGFQNCEIEFWGGYSGSWD